MPEVIAGKYEVVQTIGRGGMGTVYKAVQRNLDRTVAIKMLSEELASDPEFRARFQQEATVVARLSHPNIVAVYDIEPHNHTFCIIMEYLEGENLQAKIDRDVTLPERDVVLIGAQIARALGYAHSQGIIHRDIKPDNIHVTPAGVAKVMDFGIARFLDSKLKTQTGISMGTPKFMSPEQVTGKNVDGQTDLYSLGVCLYYCMAGRPPFDGENAIAVATRHLYEQPEPPSRFNTSITPAVEKVIMRALEKQKPERYATGFDMADALEGTLGIRSPIRIAEEPNAEVYAGATQRIQLQAVGGGTAEIDVTEPMDVAAAGVEASPAKPGRNRSPRGPGWSNITPVRMRTVTGDVDKFEAPATPSHAPVQQPSAINLLRRWWPAVAILVCLAIAAIYVALSSTESPAQIKGGGSTIQHSSPTRQFDELEDETRRLLNQNRVADARARWIAFQAANKDYPDAAAVEQKIDQLTSMLPLTQADELAKRRQQKGLNLLASKAVDGHPNRLPVAAAYLKAAVDLDSSASKLAATQLRALEHANQLSSRSEAERQAAHAALEQGKRASSPGLGTNPTEAETAFLDAVSLEPENARHWMALGQFYMDQHRTDDARVAYGEAVHVAPPDLKPEADKRLRDSIKE